MSARGFRVCEDHELCGLVQIFAGVADAEPVDIGRPLVVPDLPYEHDFCAAPTAYRRVALAVIGHRKISRFHLTAS